MENKAKQMEIGKEILKYTVFPSLGCPLGLLIAAIIFTEQLKQGRRSSGNILDTLVTTPRIQMSLLPPWPQDNRKFTRVYKNMAYIANKEYVINIILQ